MERNYKADNLRFLLIFLTVFAHFLESFAIGGKLYLLIYSFHMPVFLFLTGYYARFSVGKVWRYLLLYGIFQLLYCRYARAALQFSTPYWLLWYLFLLPFYLLLLPVYENRSEKTRRILLLLTVPMALAAGCFRCIGYDLALSRMLVFLPFFLAGFSAGTTQARKPHSRWLKWGAAAAVLAAVVLIGLCRIPNTALYGAQSYAESGSTLWMRLIFLLTASAWLVFLWLWTPNRKIPVLTALGKQTLWVYLFHGFFVLEAGKRHMFSGGYWQNLLLSLALTAAIVLMFGNPWVAKVLNRLTGGRKKIEKK